MSSASAMNIITKSFVTAMAGNTAAIEGMNETMAAHRSALSESTSISTSPSTLLKRKTEKDYAHDMAAALQRVAGGNKVFKGDRSQTLLKNLG